MFSFLPRKVRSASIAFALIAGTLPALAQEQANPVYVVAGVTFPWQDGVSGDAPSRTYVSAPGGATVGWLLGAGVFLAPAVSVEFELSSTGVMSAREPSRYSMIFNEERRDRFVGGAVRFHVPVRRCCDLEPVAGLLVVRTVKSSQIDYDSSSLPRPRPPEPRTQTNLPSRLAFTAGLDARFGGRRVAVVPSFRVHKTGRDEDLLSYYPGGFPTWTVTPGVSLRLSF
jgi:hypothetical protein